jgi:Protein of unknown function (DUF3313)
MFHRILALALCLLCYPSYPMAHATDSTPPPDLKAHNSKLTLTWLKPEASLAPFTRVMLAPTSFGYRDAKPVSGLGVDSSRSDFPVEPRDRESFEKNVRDVFRRDLGKSKHYTLTDETGPGVLVVKTSVLDYVSRIPPERTGRTEVFVDTVGDGTLVLELADGATGETLARATDRRTAAPVSSKGSFGALRSSPPLVQSEVRRLADRWGRAMADRLDQLYFATKPK